MASELLTALACVGILTGLWVAIQEAWRRTCADPDAPEDALEGRVGCRGSCGLDVCERRCAAGGAAPEEVDR